LPAGTACRYCLQGKYNLCTHIKEIGSTIDGGFAEYIRVPEEIVQIGGLVPIPDSLHDEEASLIAPLACCLNGFSQINGTVDKESSVAIIGNGPVGLLHLQLSKSLLGAPTAVIGKVPERMRAAGSLGADRVFSASEIPEMLDFTEGYGYGLVIVAASDPSALDLAAKIAAKGSKISVFAGVKAGSALDSNLVHYNQISLSGSFSSTPDNFRQAASMAGRGIIDLSSIVTHRYPLDGVGEALLATESYRGLRAAIVP
jgi:L-iditol 2-dehydrogenase